MPRMSKSSRAYGLKTVTITLPVGPLVSRTVELLQKLAIDAENNAGLADGLDPWVVSSKF